VLLGPPPLLLLLLLLLFMAGTIPLIDTRIEPMGLLMAPTVPLLSCERSMRGTMKMSACCCCCCCCLFSAAAANSGGSTGTDKELTRLLELPLRLIVCAPLVGLVLLPALTANAPLPVSFSSFVWEPGPAVRYETLQGSTPSFWIFEEIMRLVALDLSGPCS
jgi:hypothetical protein